MGPRHLQSACCAGEILITPVSNNTPWKEPPEAGGSAHAGHKRGIQPRSVRRRLQLLPTMANVRAVCIYWPQSMIICGLHVEGSSYKPAPPSDYLLSCRDCWGLTLELPPGPARPLAAGSPGWGVCRTLWLRTPAAVGTSCVGLTRSPQRSRRWGVVTLGMECAPHCHLTSGTKTPQRAVASLEGLQPACLFQGLVPRIPKEAKDDLVPTCHWK